MVAGRGWQVVSTTPAPDGHRPTASVAVGLATRAGSRAVGRAAGMGLSILSEIAIQADHRVLAAKDGFAPIDRTEVALVASPDASPATLRLAGRLAEFCNGVQAKAA